MRILYSFNKKGFEADYWTREIEAASTPEVQFFPFNHDPYLDTTRYVRAQLLDNLYFDRNPSLLRMYADFERALDRHAIDAILVDTCPPYHPDYLRGISVYKALRINDGPLSAYDRDFAYAHAYDHVLYHSPAYSRDLNMAEKLAYCGVRRADLWPLAAFDRMFDTAQTEATILSHPRDIDLVFIGALHPNKMPLLAAVKRAFGRRFEVYGLTNLKRNAYLILVHRFPGWVRPARFEDYVPLYQRSKIGINIHNRGDYTVGSYRLFDLPANGVMQISDGGPFLDTFFRLDEEIVSHGNAADLVAKCQYYLAHEEERREIALAGFRRVRRDHRIRQRLHEAAKLLAAGMAQDARSRPLRFT